MFSRNRDYTTRAEPSGGIIPTIHCVLASAPHPGVGVRTFSKEPPTHKVGRGCQSGVDFWHAVEFSRNGRFLCTHPRDSLRLSSGQFPFGLAFPTLSDSFVSDFLGAFQVSAPAFRLFAFPFLAVPTLSDPFGPDSQSAGFAFAAVGPFRRVRL